MALPRSTPSAQGVAASGVTAFVDALEQHPGIDPHGVMLVRHGHVVAEGWWAPYSADRVHLLYSLSKTFMSTAVGFAVQEGLLSLDDAVADHFPEFRDELPEASRRILVRHALAMASGHDAEMVQAAFGADPVEPVRGFLLHAPEHEPGSWFAYNQPANYTVAAILQRAAGTDLVSYLRPRLLDPLGVGPVGWQEYPPGRSLGFSGLHATTEAIARSTRRGARSGSPGCTPRPRRSRSWGCCTWTTACGRGSSSCPRAGPRRCGRTASRRRGRPTPTGRRATATRSGWRGTGIAATAHTGSSW